MKSHDQIGSVMSSSFIVVDSDCPLRDARSLLEESTPEYVIIRGPGNELRALITPRLLEEGNPEQKAEEAIDGLPHPIGVSPALPLAQVLAIVAKDFVLEPNLIGLIVLENSKPLGVVSRESLQNNAINIKGYGEHWEGSPLDILYFECPIDHERQLVDYYDPRTPPACSAGHLMNPVEI